ncbi:MAG: hypothetical protein JJ975_15400 [Bacteroidia bacterium]|nr:hypothetical protein [Bacteroidia bacterium]
MKTLVSQLLIVVLSLTSLLSLLPLANLLPSDTDLVEYVDLDGQNSNEKEIDDDVEDDFLTMGATRTYMTTPPDARYYNSTKRLYRCDFQGLISPPPEFGS